MPFSRPTRCLARLLVLGAVAAASAMDPGDRMQFADGMYVRGLYDMAADEYASLRDNNPDYPQLDLVLFRLGECYRRLGKLADADAAYAAVGTGHPESTYRPKADLRRAEMAVEGGRYQDALRVLQPLAGRNPAPDIAPPVFYYLGYCRANMAGTAAPKDRARMADAVEQPLRRVIERYPESPFASFACLDLAAFLREAGRDSTETRPLIEKALANPASPRVAAEALFQLAELSFAEGNFEASAERYRRLMTEYPDDRRVEEARLQTAWSFFNVGEHQRASELAEAGNAQNGPARGGWLYLLANCQRQLGQTAEAAATYDRLLALEPGGPHADAATYEKALLAFQEGRFDEVITAAETSGPDDQAGEDRNWLLAESYTRLDQPDRARERYRLVLEHHPDSARAPVAAYRMAEIDLAAGRYEEASGLLRSVAERWPRHELAADALYASAYAQARHGQDAEALRDWTLLAADYPAFERREDALYQLALAQWKLDRKDQAVQTLDQLLGSYPGTKYAAEAHRLAGVHADSQGRLEEAGKRLRASLLSEPEGETATRTRYRLATILQKRGMLDEAADLLQHILPEMGNQMPAPLLEWLARHQADRGQYRDAIAAATHMAGVAGAPASQQVAWFLAGEAWLKLENPVEATGAFRKSAAMDASTLEGCLACLSLGDLAVDQADYETARDAYQRAGERAQASERMEYRARSYYGLGRVAEAREQWDDAARYYLGVGILFDDPRLAPESLYRAAAAFGRLGRTADRDKTLKELNERYPEFESTQSQAE
jgi:TolA-binding protein